MLRLPAVRQSQYRSSAHDEGGVQAQLREMRKEREELGQERVELEGLRSSRELQLRKIEDLHPSSGRRVGYPPNGVPLLVAFVQVLV